MNDAEMRDAFLKAFVYGNKTPEDHGRRLYGKLNSKGIRFNIFAFLLGPYYLMYRKSYVLAACYFVCHSIFALTFEHNVIIAFLFQLAAALFVGFSFYFFYERMVMWHAKRIGRFLGESVDARIRYLRAVGGVNTAGVGIVLCVILALGLLIYLVSYASLESRATVFVVLIMVIAVACIVRKGNRA